MKIQQNQKKMKQIPFPNKKYQIIYADLDNIISLWYTTI